MTSAAAMDGASATNSARGNLDFKQSSLVWDNFNDAGERIAVAREVRSDPLERERRSVDTEGAKIGRLAGRGVAAHSSFGGAASLMHRIRTAHSCLVRVGGE